MAGRWIICLLGISALGAGWPRPDETEETKRVIGQTAEVEIPEVGLEFLGRVDTGAASTSVHAESVKVEGDMVSFLLVNRTGGRAEMRLPVLETAMVRNAEREEERIYVELSICHQGLTKRVRANLNNRSGMTYAILLGRNWLQDDFLVDVTRDSILPPKDRESERYDDKPGKLAKR